MNSEMDYFKIETNDLAPDKGRILIAEPFLSDMYFKRSIVLITEHNHQGSVGFVLNKPVNLDISELIGDFPSFDCPFSIGGPVGTNTLHFIHTLGHLIPNSIHVYDNIWWGGDFEVLKDLIKNEVIASNQVRFFLGYSGWTANQLEEELMQNSWLVTEMDSNVLMRHNMNEIWKDMLLALGSKYKMWINSPENPSLN
jgi:putative transcriptional regulator